MTTDNTQQPLWKVLNGKRSFGKWEVASTHPGDEYATNIVVPINDHGYKRLIAKTIADHRYFYEEAAEANAQYAALAVNNLAPMAEALEHLIDWCIRSTAECPPALVKAKAALQAIS